MFLKDEQGGGILLKFLGRGAGFTDEHNCAYFVNGDDLVLIDCSMTAFIKLKKFDSINAKRIVVLVTHTHSDHISGISMLIHYAYYVWKKSVLIVAPSNDVLKDIKIVLSIEGCDDENVEYTLVTVDKSGLDFIIDSILTVHVPELEGKCFGYELLIDGKHIVYTGDTGIINPFVSRLKKGSYFYCECTYYPAGVHLHVEELISMNEWFKENDIKVFLMHLDEEEKIEKLIENTGMQLVEVV